MTKMFGDIETDNVDKGGDRLSTGGTVPSDVYEATVIHAYVTQSASGSHAVNLIMELAGQRNEYRETFYVTGRDGKNYKVDEKTKVRRALPGYTAIDDLCLLTSGMSLADINNMGRAEDRVVKIYDFDLKRDVNKTLPCLVDLMGKKVKMAIVEKKSNKERKGTDGNYHKTDDVRQTNETVKFFRVADNMTTTEIINSAPEAAYMPGWLSKNKGVVQDRYQKVEGNSGMPGGFGGGSTQGGFGAQGSTPSPFGAKPAAAAPAASPFGGQQASRPATPFAS